MADLYASYSELAANETEGVDYERRTIDVAGATWASIAIHGGGIEPGSGEAARAVAASLMDHYEFAGIKPSGNTDLHVTSTNFDEPQCQAMVGASTRTLSFHGFTGTSGVAETAIGGLDTDLVARITTALQAAGFTVTTASQEINGDDPSNICNENARSAGVQLEMSRALRDSFFPGGDTSRAMRDSGQRTTTFDAYVAAVRSAFDGRGMVRLTDANVSRYCLLDAPSANVDVTASVSTDALASGGPHFMALVARVADTDNEYLCRAAFNTDQTVTLTLRKRTAADEQYLTQYDSPLTHAPGRRFWLRLQTIGAALRGKIWQDGSAEPGWQLETSDTDHAGAGQVGMRSILSSQTTGALPITAAWDGFTVTAADPGAWGVSSSGRSWRTSGGGPGDFTVGDSAGQITLTDPITSVRFAEQLVDASDCEVLMCLSVDQTASGGDLLAGALLRGAGAVFYWCDVVFGSDGTVGIEVRNVVTIEGSRVITRYTYTPGDKVWLRARIVGNRVLGRVWPDGTTEPGDWHVDRTLSTGLSPSGSVGVAAAGTGTNTNPTVSVHSFRIVDPQTMTVTRAVNGVVKDQLAGADVRLAQPAVTAL